MGRPSIKTPELIEAICARLETGEPLTSVCAADDMPSTRTVREWQEKDEAVSAALARAREIGGDAIADEALAIADERNEDPASRRVMVETRLKLLAVWHPKRYGPKQQVEHSGGVNVVAQALDANL